MDYGRLFNLLPSNARHARAWLSSAAILYTLPCIGGLGQQLRPLNYSNIVGGRLLFILRGNAQWKNSQWVYHYLAMSVLLWP